jgi:hypothetical protein
MTRQDRQIVWGLLVLPELPELPVSLVSLGQLESLGPLESLALKDLVNCL